jgi:hypothetical protein
MFPKAAMVLATALVMGSTLTVNAYINDVNTGLPTEIYYGPVCEHASRGLPVREETRKKLGCAARASASPTTSANRGPVVRQLENRPAAAPARINDKHAPW